MVTGPSATGRTLIPGSPASTLSSQCACMPGMNGSLWTVGVLSATVSQGDLRSLDRIGTGMCSTGKDISVASTPASGDGYRAMMWDTSQATNGSAAQAISWPESRADRACRGYRLAMPRYMADGPVSALRLRGRRSVSELCESVDGSGGRAGEPGVCWGQGRARHGRFAGRGSRLGVVVGGDGLRRRVVGVARTHGVWSGSGACVAMVWPGDGWRLRDGRSRPSDKSPWFRARDRLTLLAMSLRALFVHIQS